MASLAYNDIGGSGKVLEEVSDEWIVTVVHPENG
jgi:hypothetical protein